MTNRLKSFSSMRMIKTAVFLACLTLFGPISVMAQTNGQYAQLPLSIDPGVPPMVMLAMSNDHQLYYKAYTDYDDLIPPKKLELVETTYNNDFDYKGYFESGYCYSYEPAKGYFEMTGAAVNHYCNGDTGGPLWSGNFLNWATMTRIDILRSILYGGKRSTQSATQTILERSYLPNDAHSFAKYYNKADLNRLTPFTSNTSGSAQDEGLTLCNTTLHDEASKESRLNANPPLMRAIKGNYSLWAAGERYQCLVNHDGDNNDNSKEGLYGGISGVAVSGNNAEKEKVRNVLAQSNFYPHFESPDAKDRSIAENEIDFIVRVESCPTAPNNFAANLPRCRQYGNVGRPTGLLHTYGDGGQMHWGLLTGSYDYNQDSGLLRKNIADFSTEIGSTGEFTYPAESIVGTIDNLRIAGWRWLNGNPAGRAPITHLYNNNCIWGQTERNERFGDGACMDWGNPIGEIMAEAYRYFANAPAPTNTLGAGQTQEARAPDGVGIAPWLPALNNTNSCANLNVIGLNTSVQSFDNKINVNGIPDLDENQLQTLTDEVGRENGIGSIINQKYFVANNGITNDNQCNPKTLANLSDAQGACPEAPRLEGSWDIAGLARHAFKDINALPEKQSVNTYGIKLATALPQVDIVLPNAAGGDSNKSFTIVPACKNLGRTFKPGTDVVEDPIPSGNCAIVDFKLLNETTAPDASGVMTRTGSLYVNWEDSEFGGDYDQDMHGIIQYQAKANNEVIISSSILAESTDFRMGFGYILSGMGGDDGVYFDAGIEGFAERGCASRTTNVNTELNGADGSPISKSINGCGAEQNPFNRTLSFVGGSAKAENLQPPLFYAAAGGNENKGGAFFSNNDPQKLEEDFEQVLGDVFPRAPASGSGITTTNSGGADIFLHTFYVAQKSNGTGATADTVTWIGQVGALFIDNDSQLREDTVTPGVLDAGDLVVEFVTQDDELFVRKYPKGTEPGPAVNNIPPTPLEDLKYIWSTTESLNIAASNPNTRKIKTVIPANYAAAGTDRDVIKPVNNVLQDFEPNLFDAVNAPLLGGNLDAENLVRFTRGEEDDTFGFRNRTLGATTYLMGDIVGTAPLVAATPDYSFDTEFGDVGYRRYKAVKRQEEVVVYTASNNGQIQAFTAGTRNGNGYAPASGPLGTELWSFIPFNLLPHLQWLASPSYARVPYLDGFMRTYDVKAFPGSQDACPEDAAAGADGHVCGWGTILVVGTGMGGGEYPVDADGSGTANFSTRPAYIVLDVSNRSAPPKLLAEISHEDLGFTTAEPEVVRFEKGNENAWFLVFASGPRGYDQGSAQAAQRGYTVPDDPSTTLPANAKKPKMFAFNIGSQTLQAPGDITVAEDNSFVGGINGMDWDRDFHDDAIYFGTVSEEAGAPSGSLVRGRLSLSGNTLNFDFSTVVETKKPVVSRPTTAIDAQRNYWVFAGTGRYFTRQEGSVNRDDNFFMGVIEQEPANGTPGIVEDATFPLNTLLETQGIQSFTGGQVITTLQNSQNEDILTVEGLQQHIVESKKDNKKLNGWRRDFSGANERQVSESALAASVLFFTTTAPPIAGAVLSCDLESSGFLYQIDMRSGVPTPFSQNFTDASPTFSLNGQVDTASVAVGENEKIADGTTTPDPFDNIVNNGKGGLDVLNGIKIEESSGRQSWREVPITWEQ